MHFPMGVAQVSRLIIWAVVISPTAIAAETSADLTIHNAFNKDLVVSLARQLAAKPFETPPEVSRQLSDIGYDQYNDIRYRPRARLWSGEGLEFEVDFRHAGFIYKHPVQVFEVVDSVAEPVEYHHTLFDFGPSEDLRNPELENGFSGIRIWSAHTDPAALSEFIVFQGASYFRSRGNGQSYGLSARGLAINTAEPEGEEFPFFRAFWIERPERGATSITVHALLDSERATGAYTFVITPGHETVMKVTAQLFTRESIEVIGIAPLTSMFLFGPLNQHRFDDFRNAVHDSDGLLMRRENGEWLWRALTNPTHLQVSMFVDANPQGFGLMQRSSKFEDFQDLQARYERRPSAWVEPIGEWGKGSVELVEIPTQGEFNDNIVAFWRPVEAIPPNTTQTFSYLLRWGPSVGDPRLAQVIATRSGLTLHDKRRMFVVDFQAAKGSELELDKSIQVKVSASRGELRHVVGRPNEIDGGYRVSFELEPGGEELSELSLVLLRDGKVVSERWLFRWTKD